MKAILFWYFMFLLGFLILSAGVVVGWNGPRDGK